RREKRHQQRESLDTGIPEVLQAVNVSAAEVEKLENRIKELEQGKATNEQYGWLHKMADDHANAIQSRIKVESYFFCYDRSPQPLRLYMGLVIHNKSVFDITIKDEAMKGHIKFWNQALLGGKRINPTSTIIPATDHRTIIIEQDITQEQYQHI